MENEATDVFPQKAVQITRAIVSQLSILFGLAAVLAFSVAVIFWATKPEFAAVIEHASQSEVHAIVDMLESKGIEYQTDLGRGRVSVGNNRLDEVRLMMAAEGLSQTHGTGFELLQKEQTLGTSQFIETARYQHALETELSRSINAMRNIDSSRVHLALPKRTSFMRKKDQATASVVVKLLPGTELERTQIRSITHLVASSVPYLSTKSVTVVDQWGNLLSAETEDPAMEFSEKQFEYKQKLEQSYKRRIESMLAPLFGFGRIKAQVNTDIDFTYVESTQELFDSDGEQIRSEQISDAENRSGAAGGLGIPGALTNQPPAAGTLAENAEGEAATPAEPVSVNRNSVRNYELDKTIRHVKQPLGELQKITVAVIVDDNVTTDASGAETRTPLSEEDINVINGIVSDAIGFDEARGDRVSVFNRSFVATEVQELPEVPIWEQGWFASVIKQAFAGIAVLLILFMVVKPTMKTLQGGYVSTKTPALGNQQANSGGAQQVMSTMMGDGGANSPMQMIAHAPNYVEQLAMAKELVGKDSKQVAKVVKNWVANNG